MAERTNISFAHHTGSPWIGCTKVNDDCANCYADALDIKRFSKTLGGATKENPQRHWGKGMPRVRTVGFWNDARTWNKCPMICDACGGNFPIREDGYPDHYVPQTKEDREAGLSEVICKGETFQRARMFPSLCDWLDDEVPIEWLVDFMKLVFECQNLTWMLFTKRPENFHRRIYTALDLAIGNCWMSGQAVIFLRDWLQGKPPKHVWIFASAGNQKNANVMIPNLLTIPAAVHGVSCEPMTGPVEFQLEWLAPFKDTDPMLNKTPRVDVVIFGGESDQSRPARACNVQWIADGVKQCRDAGALPYVKQLGSHVICDNVNAFDWPQEEGPELNTSRHTTGFASGRVMLAHKSGADMQEWPEELRIQQLPERKEAA